jgi:hypothetical protein
MANNLFQNNTVDLNDLWYKSHKKLIKRIAIELNASDRQDELISKFIGTPLKIKKQKDPSIPKRPKSSFLFFCDEHRDNIRQNNTELKMGEVMKKLGNMWSKCTNKDKYVQLAETAKDEYEIALDEYNDNNCYH